MPTLTGDVPQIFEGPMRAARYSEEDQVALQNGTFRLRVAVLNDRALSLGVSQSDSEGCARRARALGIPVFRRTSGGTGILHRPGDVVWSIILPRSHALVGPSPVGKYDRLGASVVRFLRELDVSARWAESPGLSPDFCLLGPRGQSLFTGDRVTGGAAQHLTADALLHHGVIPYDQDRQLLARVFEVSPIALRDRLTSLRDLGVDLSPAALAERLARVEAEELR